MRTPTTSWILVLAALPALGAAGCGDDTGATTTSSSSNDDGGGGSPGTGGGGTTTSGTTASTAATGGGTTTSTSTGGEGGAGGQGGEGGAGGGDGGAGGAGGEGGAPPDLCGNAELDVDEDCDGANLGGSACTDVGFVGGTLACNDDCTFDTSGCLDAVCGDAQVTGSEDCEGTDVGDATCETEGFVGGTLACADCAFDTSACTTCGNDVVDGDDLCDGTALGGATCADVDPQFTGGVLACAPGCAAYDTTACTTFPFAGPGELVITEIMEDPTALDDSAGEWFEIHNPSPASTFQLRGCRFVGTGQANDMFTVTADLEIEPGGYLTFARTATPGFTPDFVWPSGMQLANAADGIALICADVEVDSVEYDTAAGWPNPAGGGASMSLDPEATAADENDVPDAWCASLTATAAFTSGDLGSPGEANPPCAADLVIGSCRLQFPPTFTAEEGLESQAIYGRVFIEGFTDVNQTGNDALPGLLASVGFGPDGSDPSVDPSSWSFEPAMANDAYDTTSPGFDATEDEWVGTFTVPADEASPYDYAFRFSGDGGETWTYCDLDGSANGYAADQAGALVSEPSTQTFNLIFSEYIEGSSNNKAIEITNLGADVDVSGCDVLLLGNGDPLDDPTNTYAMSGTLAAGASFVICNSQEVDFGDACDVDSAVTFFNGDDALAIVCNGAIVDAFGQIGFDPPSGVWGTGVEDTVDVILRRECSVTTGDTNGSDAFDPAAEWVGINYTSAEGPADLGLHECP
jgi:hypothetical protein